MQRCRFLAAATCRRGLESIEWTFGVASTGNNGYSSQMTPEKRGLLIAFEGVDGAGKTTQVKLLAEFMERIGEPVVRSKEPTDGPWGQKIRASAASVRMPPRDELEAFVEGLKRGCRDLNIDYLPLRTDTPLNVALSSYLAHRKMRTK